MITPERHQNESYSFLSYFIIATKLLILFLAGIYFLSVANP